MAQVGLLISHISHWSVGWVFIFVERHLLLVLLSYNGVHLEQSEAGLTLLVHAGLFCRFHNPPSSDMDYRIFNVRM